MASSIKSLTDVLDGSYYHGSLTLALRGKIPSRSPSPSVPNEKLDGAQLVPDHDGPDGSCGGTPVIFDNVNSSTGVQTYIHNLHAHHPDPNVGTSKLISEASYIRDRRNHPPNSNCMPNTRRDVIERIVSWADAENLANDVHHSQDPPSRAHIYWLYGSAGCGKSAIAQTVASEFGDGAQGRLLGSFFFFRGSNRSHFDSFVITLAEQMRLSFPAARFTVGVRLSNLHALQGASVDVLLRRLIFEPFIEAAAQNSKRSRDHPIPSAVEPPWIAFCIAVCAAAWAAFVSAIFLTFFGGHPTPAPQNSPNLNLVDVRRPYLLVIDGLDECDDRNKVSDFIHATIEFFDREPNVPLRILITSRIEGHIQGQLKKASTVITDNLDSRTPGKDIDKYLAARFKEAAEENAIIQAYEQGGDQWPSNEQRLHLAERVNGSFILAATVTDFILNAPNPIDQMECALSMKLGLDTLYTDKLQESAHLDHFNDIISTLALLRRPISLANMSLLLDIKVYIIVVALDNLRAIVNVPGTDEGRATFYHTSFRDYLTDSTRSHGFCASPGYPLRIVYRCLDAIELRHHTALFPVLYSQWTEDVRNCDIDTARLYLVGLTSRIEDRVEYMGIVSMLYSLVLPDSKPTLHRASALSKIMGPEEMRTMILIHGRRSVGQGERPILHAPTGWALLALLSIHGTARLKVDLETLIKEAHPSISLPSLHTRFLLDLIMFIEAMFVSVNGTLVLEKKGRPTRGTCIVILGLLLMHFALAVEHDETLVESFFADRKYDIRIISASTFLMLKTVGVVRCETDAHLRRLQKATQAIREKFPVSGTSIATSDIDQGPLSADFGLRISGIGTVQQLEVLGLLQDYFQMPGGGGHGLYYLA
ncbi:hypothetical protein D9611_007145 [Ephemerocybe angulata]|uniref:Nephrocystin 3-like N-terminal domain-containing protein n=1 Tax=Ephemerocybe angulata TaxID=980116 RepID=A0A8H5B168_9AGAR|nr:hypothetical protein D9611_007145 [Tulosesus angulatus]